MNKEINIVQNIVKQKGAWIVGGYVRDIFMGRQPKDVDFVISESASSVAKEFARVVGGKFITLDDFNKIYRVVFHNNIFDFSQMQGKNIGEDLGRRDFSVNAMAVPINDMGTIIDLFGGRKDIKNRVVRAVSEKNLREDPVRLLRAYRFSAQLGFKIDSQTEKQIKKLASLIKKPAPERIREEIFLILCASGSAEVFFSIYEAGLLKEILPELTLSKDTAKCYYKNMGVLGHSFRALEKAEEFYGDGYKGIFGKYGKPVFLHMDGVFSGKIKRIAMLKLAVILHDIGKPATAKKIDGRLRFFMHEERGAQIIKDVGARLRLSNNETAYLQKLIRQHMRIGNLTASEKLTEKAIWRYFRDCGGDTVDVVVLSIADAYTYPKSRMRDAHLAIAKKLFRNYFEKKEEVLPKRLLNGNDVMKILKIPEGPKVGEILSKLEEAQVTKKIMTCESAADYIRALYKKN